MKKAFLFFLLLSLMPFREAFAASVNPTSPKTQGIVVSADAGAGRFRIKVDGNVGLQMIFYVTGDTQYFSDSAPASFDVLQKGTFVSVVYTTNADMTESIAETVTAGTQK